MGFYSSCSCCSCGAMYSTGAGGWGGVRGGSGRLLTGFDQNYSPQCRASTGALQKRKSICLHFALVLGQPELQMTGA